MWKYWCKALGNKSFEEPDDADVVSWIRTGIVFIYIVTNLFIIAGILHHW